MHYTHDSVVNPTARPYGTKQSEVSDFGHAILQLMTYGAVRGINIQESVDIAIENLRSKDFQKVRKQTSKIWGISTMIFSDKDYFIGLAVLESDVIYGADNRGNILIASHPHSDARLIKFSGIVTDHGGIACHAAIICRENKIPCIVGTGNATELIKIGNEIRMNLNTGEVTIIR